MRRARANTGNFFEMLALCHEAHIKYRCKNQPEMLSFLPFPRSSLLLDRAPSFRALTFQFLRDAWQR